MYRVVAIPSALTASQTQVATQQLIGDAASRGVPITPLVRSQGKPTFFAVGDSITFGLGVSSPWESNMSLNFQPTLNVLNYGISGIDLSQIASSDSNRIVPMCTGGNGPQVATVFAGTNDIFNGDSVTNTLTYMALEVQQLKAAGCRVFIGTMLSRTGFDSQKDTYDTALLQQGKTIGADGFIDFASDVNLGADGASANSTWFQADGTHPTQTGQNRMGVIASNALNYYFGSNSAIPTIVTATHTIAPGEGYITANPTANATLTLPDCTGLSGVTYTVTNIQSAFTVGVVAGSSSQLINGLAASTVVPVPAHGSLTLRDVPNPKTVSGCHWEM
jgi:lysophospholipase L1-like esterase